jgi:ectoine hydroxylase-related dioxygenase (phytanoyl-CoA dioxygenase family)
MVGALDILLSEGRQRFTQIRAREVETMGTQHLVEQLSAADVERYRRDGFVMGGKVISDETVEECRSAMDELTSSPVPEGTLYVDLMTRSTEPTKATFDYFTFLWRTREEFRKVAFSPRLARMAAQLLETDRVVLFGDSLFIKHARTGGSLHFHQDVMAWPLDKPGGLTCWIALDGATPENGSMVFAAGSNSLGERLPVDSVSGETLYKGFVGGDRAASEYAVGDLSKTGLKPMTAEELEQFPKVSTTYAPGECSFHSTLVWHASGSNPTGDHRRAFSIRYADGNRIWLGEQKAFYYFKDDEAGVEVGAPIGGPNFPVVWPVQPTD